MSDWDSLSEEEKTKEVRNTQLPILAKRYGKDEQFFEERKRTNWDSNNDKEKEGWFIKIENAEELASQFPESKEFFIEQKKYIGAKRRGEVIKGEYKPRKDLMIDAARRDLNPSNAICELIDNSIDRKQKLFKDKISLEGDLTSSIKSNDIVILMTMWDEFIDLPNIINKTKPDIDLIDGRRQIKKNSVKNYFGIGLG